MTVACMSMSTSPPPSSAPSPTDTISWQMSVELASTLVFLTAAVSMLLPVFTHDFPTILGAFLVLETCVGAFYSCSGLMRSRYLPGELQSSVMNIFRLPLNVLVVVGTRITDLAEPQTVFMVIASWFFVSSLLQLRLSVESSERSALEGSKAPVAGGVAPELSGGSLPNGVGVKNGGGGRGNAGSNKRRKGSKAE